MTDDVSMMAGQRPGQRQHREALGACGIRLWRCSGLSEKCNVWLWRSLERLGVNWRAGEDVAAKFKANPLKGCPWFLSMVTGLVNGNGTAPAIHVFASFRKFDKTCAALAYSRGGPGPTLSMSTTQGETL